MRSADVFNYMQVLILVACFGSKALPCFWARIDKTPRTSTQPPSSWTPSRLQMMAGFLHAACTRPHKTRKWRLRFKVSGYDWFMSVWLVCVCIDLPQSGHKLDNGIELSSHIRGGIFQVSDPQSRDELPSLEPPTCQHHRLALQVHTIHSVTASFDWFRVQSLFCVNTIEIGLRSKLGDRPETLCRPAGGLVLHFFGVQILVRSKRPWFFSSRTSLFWNNLKQVKKHTYSSSLKLFGQVAIVFFYHY